MKRIICLMVAIVMIVGCTAVFAAPSNLKMGYSDAFVNALSDLQSKAISDDHIKFIDINNDGLDEMIVMYYSTAAYVVNVYSYAPEAEKIRDNVSVNEIINQNYTNSGEVSEGDVSVYVQKNTITISNTVHYVGKAQTDAPYPHEAGGYTKLSLTSLGEIKEEGKGAYTYFDEDGKYYVTTKDDDVYYGHKFPGEKSVTASTAAKAKQLKEGYEQGKKVKLYDVEGENGVVFDASFEDMTIAKAIETLNRSELAYVSKQYSILNDVTEEFSDEEKLKMQNLIVVAGECVYDEVVFANLTQDEIAEYALQLAHYATPFVGPEILCTMPKEPDRIGPNRRDVRVDDIEKAMYKYFGIDFDVSESELEICEEAAGRCVNVWERIDSGNNMHPYVKTIYELGNGYYYVLFDYISLQDGGLCEEQTVLNDGTFSDEKYNYPGGEQKPIYNGYVVIKERKEKAGNEYYAICCGHRRKTYMEMSDLDKYISIERDASNVKFDYSKVSEFTQQEEYIGYLEDMVTGVTPNEEAEKEIVKYIEYSYESLSPILMKVKKNRIIVAADNINAAVTRMQKVKRGFEKILDKNNIVLSRAPQLCIKCDVAGAKLKKGLTVEFDASLKKACDKVQSIKVIFDENRQSVSVNTQDLVTMLKKGTSSVRIGIKKNNYKVEFLDKNGKTINQCAEKMTFAFSSENEYNVVYKRAGKKNELIGGQNNTKNAVIEFMTDVSAEYFVKENYADLSDVRKFSEDERKAIEFMMSRKLMDADENKFDPYGNLSKNELTKALVNIFYAYESDAETSFKDVKKGDKYYSYIASAQKNGIDVGFESKNFNGEKTIKKEELISIAARLLSEQVGYSYPGKPDKYVDFMDGDKISGWENQEKEIALAVREGLLGGGGVLSPQQNITRIDAAVMLYRMYNLVYSVDSAPIPTLSETAEFPVIPLILGILAVLAAACAGCVRLYRNGMLNIGFFAGKYYELLYKIRVSKTDQTVKNNLFDEEEILSARHAKITEIKSKDEVSEDTVKKE